jgi:hypothetical protein
MVDHVHDPVKEEKVNKIISDPHSYGKELKTATDVSKDELNVALVLQRHHRGLRLLKRKNWN